MPETRGRTGRPPAGAAVLQEDVTAAITAAVFVELAEVGYGRLSIEAVAKRAGVGKTAVYRRWPTKQAMVVALVSEVAVAAIGLPDTGSLRGDLLAILTATSVALRHPLAGRIIPDLFAEATRRPELAEALLTTVRDPRRSRAAVLFERAVGRGELPADTDRELALDFLVGPLYWRLAVVHTEIADDYFERLADKIIGALRA
ncbi:MAG TPA: TetR/AcrR family transcriptional regulator [Pseudonocardiaceae bacterium]|jgi:AcrR family transcriptional regulator|nr:TetR/AcrR family transcriptional regulator [Pseudonocardiaceae bacterium]